MRVLQEWTLDRRLFQIAGAAERKPRAPNERLQRVTERRLAEAQLTSSAWSVPRSHWIILARYGGGGSLPVCVVGHCGNFQFDTTTLKSVVIF